jgi:hypothetical protein
METIKKLKIGKKARISAGSGIDSDKIVTIVDKSKIKTDGRGVPTNVSGAYKPVNWSKEEAIQYSDGSFGTMYKNRLTPVDNMNEATPPNFPTILKNKIRQKYGNHPEAYATMWKIHNKYGNKLEEILNEKIDFKKIIKKLKGGDKEKISLSAPEFKKTIKLFPCDACKKPYSATEKSGMCDDCGSDPWAINHLK